MQAIREMVGAAPVCPPERPRSDVSMRKEHVPMRKGDVSIRKEHIPSRKGRVFMRRNVCRLRMMHIRYRWMRPCRATRAGTQAPPLPASIKPISHATFLGLARRRIPRRQPSCAFVHRRSLCRRHATRCGGQHGAPNNPQLS